MSSVHDVEFVECVASSLGVVLKDVKASRDIGTSLYKPLKFTLSPSPAPKELLEEISFLQPHFNVLVDTLSRDVEFLRETLKRTIEVDEFTRKLLEIFEKSCQSKPKPVTFGVFRSDYMVHCNGARGSEILSFKQVEMNTVAVAYGALSPDVVEFHRIMNADSKENQPEPCNSLQMIVDVFAQVHELYGKEKAVTLTVIADNETNILDQRKIDIQLWARYQIKTIRYTLTQLHKLAKHGPNGELLVNDMEVSIVYYRSGFIEDHYYSPDGAEWKFRMLAETSSAICLPSIGHHLVGSKKIQQVLAMPGVLERFVTDESIVKRMRDVFAGLYSLDLTPEGDRAASRALKDPQDFVLKPQKEGGGNNFFGDEIRTILRDLDGKKEREQYILMDMIRSPTHKVQVFINGAIGLAEVVPEYSVFGLYLRHGNDVLLNNCVPYLVRSKAIDSTECGISEGGGMLDSLTLLSSDEYKEKVVLH